LYNEIVDLEIKIRAKILDIKLKSQSTNMRPGEQKTYSFVSLKAQETWNLTPLPASFLQNLTKKFKYHTFTKEGKHNEVCKQFWDRRNTLSIIPKQDKKQSIPLKVYCLI
jgi:hypothetical protein